MAKRKAKQSDDHEGRFTIQIGDHTLTGTKAGGKWTFRCPDWPELEKRFNGDASCAGISGEFTRRALAGKFTFKIE
jgi:hypothetical protein